MLAPTDLLQLPYTPDLTESGIAYACRSLACSYNRIGASPLERMRQNVASVAVDLAFRRHLGEQRVPFDVLAAAPFTDPDHYDISLGGHRCELNTTLLPRRRQIALIRREPGLLLQAPALVPLDRFTVEDHQPDDIYLFAFLLGLVAASLDDVERALSAGQPAYLIHPMPDKWARPTGWLPFERLALKSECDQPIRVELGGQDAERGFITQSFDLPPRTRIAVPGEWYSLAYVHALSRPEARIGLHSPRRGEAYLIRPVDWGNAWVYGMDIFLAGWISREDFRRKAYVLNAGMPTFQTLHAETKSLALLFSELEPLIPLFERVKKWEAAPRVSAPRQR